MADSALPDTPMAPLPPLNLAEGLKASDVDADEVVEQWLAALQDRLDRKDCSDLNSLFIEDCWWRDQVALSWDTRTLRGTGPVGKYFTASDHGLSALQTIKPSALQPTLLNNNGLIWIKAGFSFQTRFGSGQGVLHLANVSKDQWKAWLVLTQLQALKDEGEPEWNIHANGIARTAIKTGTEDTTNGTTNGHVAGTSQPDFQVIIVGAGQSGLALGAQLKNKGITYLIVDKMSRIGDSWRGRYQTVTSHTPKYTDHYPFLPFPSNYPKWLNREKVTNWQESYAAVMELNTRLSTDVMHVAFDASTSSYRLDVRPAGQPSAEPSNLTARHVVLATGIFGLEPIVPHFPSEQHFPGQLYHAKHHQTAAQIPDVAQKKIVIVGAGTSAHDIAEDFAAHGAAKVTMVQRGAIFAVSRASIEKHLLSMWNTPGMSTAEADLISHSFPFPLLRTMSVGQTMMMCADDSEALDALQAKGMRLKRGETGEGLIDHQLLKAGHFYIDQGAWKHVLDGSIDVVACEGGVADIHARGLRLADGRELDADVVVLATGYERCHTTVRALMGQAVLDRIGAVGDLDAEAERVAWWRPTALPGFWYMTGSFIWARQFSALLALQIQAVEQGLNARYWDA